MIKVTERGWPGHFICGDRCTFTRNTLLEGENDSVIVSTVGNMVVDGKVEQIGYGRYYETMVFGTKQNGPYIDINVEDQREVNGKWAINVDLPDDVDNVANAMHENVVKEFMLKMEGKDDN